MCSPPTFPEKVSPRKEMSTLSFLFKGDPFGIDQCSLLLFSSSLPVVDAAEDPLLSHFYPLPILSWPVSKELPKIWFVPSCGVLFSAADGRGQPSRPNYLLLQDALPFTSKLHLTTCQVDFSCLNFLGKNIRTAGRVIPGSLFSSPLRHFQT